MSNDHSSTTVIEIAEYWPKRAKRERKVANVKYANCFNRFNNFEGGRRVVTCDEASYLRICCDVSDPKCSHEAVD